MSDQITAANYYDVLTAAYRKAARGSRKSAADRQTAIATAMDEVLPMIEDGRVTMPYEDALHSHLMAVDAKDGALADNILTKIANGEIGLSIWPDPLLEVVVTLGGGRRKAWSNVTAEDLADMAGLRNQNTNSARRAERRFLKNIKTVESELILAGTVGEMVARARAVSA